MWVLLRPVSRLAWSPEESPACDVSMEIPRLDDLQRGRPGKRLGLGLSNMNKSEWWAGSHKHTWDAHPARERSEGISGHPVVCGWVSGEKERLTRAWSWEA